MLLTYYTTTKLIIVFLTFHVFYILCYSRVLSFNFPFDLRTPWSPSPPRFPSFFLKSSPIFGLTYMASFDSTVGSSKVWFSLVYASDFIFPVHVIYYFLIGNYGLIWLMQLTLPRRIVLGDGCFYVLLTILALEYFAIIHIFLSAVSASHSYAARATICSHDFTTIRTCRACRSFI